MGSVLTFVRQNHHAHRRADKPLLRLVEAAPEVQDDSILSFLLGIKREVDAARIRRSFRVCLPDSTKIAIDGDTTDLR